LHGDIMATATTSPTATGPAATYVYTEFGSPEVGSPGSYGWLGGDQISGNALGGQLLMGARAYNTNTGRFSQADPIPGGSANAYDYAAQNPVINQDLSGKTWYPITDWFQAYDYWGFPSGWQTSATGVLSKVQRQMQTRYIGIWREEEDLSNGHERFVTRHYRFIYIRFRYLYWWFGWRVSTYGDWHLYTWVEDKPTYFYL
jgi:RHS repeat-associated protein